MVKNIETVSFAFAESENLHVEIREETLPLASPTQFDSDPLAETLIVNQPSAFLMSLLTNTILLSATLLMIFALLLRRFFYITEITDDSK